MVINSSGIILGVVSIFISQLLTVSYLSFIDNNNDYTKNLLIHFSQLEGIFLLSLYLSISWYYYWLPTSYYFLDPPINWYHVFCQLIVQDAGQYIVHRIEHYFKPLYRLGHKHHHKHIHPQWFNSFEGSICDTICMVIIPLVVTSNIVYTVNTKSYIAFGVIYSSMLVLIHSNHEHPWEKNIRLIGIGTSLDHKNHHLFFSCNYGHLFMWWDMIFGTYKNK